MDAMHQDTQIDYIFEAIYTRDGAFKEKQREEDQKTWINRLGGWVGVWIGIGCLFAPFIYLFSFFTLLANVLWLAAMIISFVVSIPITMIVIEISWFAHRPKLALATITICGAAVALVIWLTKAE